jgi:Methylamine utilisation protein MauE
MTASTASSAVAAGLLVVVFAWSGATKIARPFGAAVALTRFRLARHVRPDAARAIGLGELALAVALLLDPAGIGSLVAAAVVLAAFSAVVARAVRAGETFPCACFGNEQRPLSTATIVRNLGLLAVAGAGLAAAVVGVRTTAADRAYGFVFGALLVCGVLLLDRLVATRPFRSDLDLRHGAS